MQIFNIWLKIIFWHENMNKKLNKNINVNVRRKLFEVLI